jgi:hypothetical protein
MSHPKGGFLQNRFRDVAHLIRPAIVLVAGLVLFLVVRAAVIPKEFGKYGHYRPGYLEAARSKPIQYAGQDVCAGCHDAEATTRAAGKHAKVACEACHGPQAKHADDPSALKPKLPEVKTLCARCHEKDAAKPQWFPQVVTADHSGGMACNDCHKPHNPHL